MVLNLITSQKHTELRELSANCLNLPFLSYLAYLKAYTFPWQSFLSCGLFLFHRELCSQLPCHTAKVGYFRDTSSYSVICQNHKTGLVWLSEGWLCLQKCNHRCHEVFTGTVYISEFKNGKSLHYAHVLFKNYIKWNYLMYLLYSASFFYP